MSDSNRDVTLVPKSINFPAFLIEYLEAEATKNFQSFSDVVRQIVMREYKEKNNSNKDSKL